MPRQTITQQQRVLPLMGTTHAILGMSIGLLAGMNAAITAVAQQAPPGWATIPGVTQAQALSLVQIDTELRPLVQRVTVAQSALTTASLLDPKNDQAIQAHVDALKAAELTVANAREVAFAKSQESSNRLEPEQVAAFRAMGATTVFDIGLFRRGSIPDLSKGQTLALGQMMAELQPFMRAEAAASFKLAASSIADKNAMGIKAAADALAKAELDLAESRANAFEKLQASADKLSPLQITVFAGLGGIFYAPRLGATGGNNGPTPLAALNFNDHEGYVSLFDGESLKGWDGNPKFWRVEDGEIVGESTPENPSGNNYIVYRAVEAHDFTLKLEIKDDNSGGTGIQYRSQIGIPWLSPVGLDVIANAGPTNLNWILTGPQADFWPFGDPGSRNTGQFYSENNPMRIMASRGNVVEGAGLGPKRLMGSIGDSTLLYTSNIKPTDWNEYTIIARGGTFIHIINGQLMAVMVDDDPNSLNNKSGYIGIELEANARIHIRNIWLKKLN